MLKKQIICWIILLVLHAYLTTSMVTGCSCVAWLLIQADWLFYTLWISLIKQCHPSSPKMHLFSIAMAALLNGCMDDSQPVGIPETHKDLAVLPGLGYIDWCPLFGDVTCWCLRISYFCSFSSLSGFVVSLSLLYYFYIVFMFYEHSETFGVGQPPNWIK